MLVGGLTGVLVGGFTSCSFRLSSSAGAELFRGSRGHVLGFEIIAEFRCYCSDLMVK